MEISSVFSSKGKNDRVWKTFELLDYSLIFFQLFDNSELFKSQTFELAWKSLIDAFFLMFQENKFYLSLD